MYRVCAQSFGFDRGVVLCVICTVYIWVSLPSRVLQEVSTLFLCKCLKVWVFVVINPSSRVGSSESTCYLL